MQRSVLHWEKKKNKLTENMQVYQFASNTTLFMYNKYQYMPNNCYNL